MPGSAICDKSHGLCEQNCMQTRRAQRKHRTMTERPLYTLNWNIKQRDEQNMSPSVTPCPDSTCSSTTRTITSHSVTNKVHIKETAIKQIHLTCSCQVSASHCYASPKTPL